ncbi:MAG TPA: phospholipase D-like domain-containing protein [bacterium]|nr:phospholipase D-like domain-containing protein [bacterium]
MLLIPKFRNIPSRIMSLLESLILLSMGFLIYFFVIPEPPPLEETLRLSPAPIERNEENGSVDGKNTGSPPPATTVRDHYEFAGGEIFFDDAVEPVAVAFIDRASRNLRAVTYTIEPSPPVEALEKATARGVTVAVVAGKNGFERTPAFAFTEFHPTKGILHEKFLVADERRVFISSRNLTPGQSKNAAILFSDAPRLATILSEEFSSLEEMRVEKRCQTGCPVEYGTLYFIPGKGCVAAKDTLLSANESISLAMYTMTVGTPVMTGLKKNLKKGRALRLILDDWSAENGSVVNLKAANYLESLGGAVLFDRLNDTQGRPMNFHHKFAVIDDGAALVFGSMNWTKAGCYRNRELLFITRNGDIASIFKTYFDDMMNALAPAEERGQAHKLPDPTP